MKVVVEHIPERLSLYFREFGIRKKIGDLVVLFATDHTRANPTRALKRMSEQEDAAREKKRARTEEVEEGELAAADAADRAADFEIAFNQDDINNEANELINDFDFD